MKKNEYQTSDYTIIISKARGKAKEKYAYKIEVQITELLISYFDHNTVNKITNTIYSMLYPRISLQNLGFTTKIVIEVMNTSLCKQNKGILFGYIKRIDCKYTEEKIVLHFKIEIELFTKEGHIATSQLEVYPTNL